MTAEVEAAIHLLHESGYLVVKIPACTREGGHGSHSLITRTARCEGAEPKPHGFSNGHYGSFGYIVICSCGEWFNDYHLDIEDDSPTPWELHKTEQGIVDKPPRSVAAASSGDPVV